MTYPTNEPPTSSTAPVRPYIEQTDVTVHRDLLTLLLDVLKTASAITMAIALIVIAATLT
jgi:hypothetical protein